MKLYIIGNGFDLGHDLPTSYWDFRNYLDNLYPDFLRAFEEHYYIYPNMMKEEKCNLLWYELEANLANIDEDIIIENAVSIDMDLESGDVGIEDTLYEYFSEEYSYIQRLAKYLKQWVRTIRIRDTKKRTSHIRNSNDALYVTFNYTAVLENVYGISHNKITHIHGSLREYDLDPVLGHGNKARIEKIQEKKLEAERLLDEKWMSICKVVEDYYSRTFKDVGKYAMRLLDLAGKSINEIEVIGHSLAGVDMLYFKNIDMFTRQSVIWKVYYLKPEEETKFFNSLVAAGINSKRIQMLHTSEFYDY